MLARKRMQQSLGVLRLDCVKRRKSMNDEEEEVIGEVVLFRGTAKAKGRRRREKRGEHAAMRLASGETSGPC